MDSENGAAPVAGGLSDEILTVIRENTIAVMTDRGDERAEWQEMLQRLLQKARGERQTEDEAFLQAVYNLTEGKTADLPEGNPYQRVLAAIQSGIGAAGPAAAEEKTTGPAAAETDVSADIMNTIRNNTVAVMTAVPEKREEWRAAIATIHEQAANNNLTEDSTFFQALLDLLDGKPVSLPGSNPYAVFLRGILEAIDAYGGEADGSAPRVAPGSGLTANLIKTIRENTIAVMTNVPEKRDQWRTAVEQVLSQAETGQLPADVDFFQAILDILDDEKPKLPPDNPHAGTIEAILAAIAGEGSGEADAETEAMLAAVRSFLTTENWTETRKVLEENQEVLLRPEVEELFAANIRHAREQGQTQAADMMQIHLMLLRDAKKLGIPAAFERLEALVRAGTEAVEAEKAAQQEPEPEPEPETGPVPTAPGLPDSFVKDVAAALRGPSARKQQLFEALSHLHPKEAGAEALIREVQKALFGDSIDRLGGKLESPYDSLWQAIVERVKREK